MRVHHFLRLLQIRMWKYCYLPTAHQALQLAAGRAAVTIDLKPEQQRVIDLAVQSGAYRNPGEVLDQAFEIIREQLDLEDWMLGQREEVAAHIATGFAQAERGELMDGDAALEILRRRRSTRLKSQG
jgi:Arc/MetJ-type ribon-helix-helix transcriptional regulator